MTSRSDWVPFVRDALLATAVLAAVYALGQRVDSAVVAVPYYVLLSWFDVLAEAVGAAGAVRAAVLACYLLGLGVVGAATASVVRRRVEAFGRVGTGAGLAAPFAVLGALALLFAAVTLVTTDQWEPVRIVGTVGVGLLLVAATLLAVVDGAVASWRSARDAGD